MYVNLERHLYVEIQLIYFTLLLLDGSSYRVTLKKRKLSVYPIELFHFNEKSKGFPNVYVIDKETFRRTNQEYNR